MPPTYQAELSLSGGPWKYAWKQDAFKKKCITGIALTAVLLFAFPFFFHYIENRNGFQLQDIVLDNLGPHDVSLPIFFAIWSMTILAIVRSVQSPAIFLTCIYSFVILSVARMLTIMLVPLNAPDGLIPLVDPLSNMFYGKTFVTKDLFFSGHTACQFLIFMCLDKRKDKMLALTSTVIVGICILIQHVHYTFDVIAAPFFAYICCTIGKRLATSEK